MRQGQYVRCPIVVEENDNKYPRSFVLGKIMEINSISEEVRVSLFDLRRSGGFFAHAFDKTVFAMDKVSHCPAARKAPVNTTMGKGKILRLCEEQEEWFFYYVLLENGVIEKFSEENMEIEYSAADYSPVEQLRQYEFQNPTWYANRLCVSANLHMIENAIYGFEVLAGCRTFLMAHQISTVVRAFEEPTVSYMLADAVGLGKTIEACGIIKIMCSENQNLRVLYLLPGALAAQWENELRLKFGIQASHNSAMGAYVNHFILPIEDLDEYCEELAYPWDLVLVDETHRLLGMEEKYRLVLSLTQRCKHVLLLSATPIQDRKEEYLKLLTLLLPDQYGNMDIELFSDILSKQKKIQRRVNAMLRHMKSYEEYKEDTYDKIVELADSLNDKHLARLAAKIELESVDGGCEAAGKALSYVSENYRIERKVIRNRREYIAATLGKRVLFARPYEMASETECYNEENTYYSLLQYLKSALENGQTDVSVAEVLLQAMFSSPWALLDTLQEYGVTDEGVLTDARLWRAQAEEEIGMADILLDQEPDRIRGRLVRIVDYIEQEIGWSERDCGKIVIFSEFKQTIEKLGELLERRKICYSKFCAGLDRETLENNVYEFQNNGDCKIILCDATGGEGRNFQIADWLIFTDLPWNANAIEQRIGRLDRLGRDAGHLEVRLAVFYSQRTIEEQLFHIWKRGLGVFEQSLSGLEIITGELNQTIGDAFGEDIYNGLENSLADIIELMENAREAVEEEQLYDSGSVLYRPLSQAVEQMLQTYQGSEGNLFQSAMLGWSTQAGLRSNATENPNIIEFGEYRFSPRAAIQALFIPPDWTKYENTSIMRREGKILGTFDRGTAIKREDMLFFAPEDPVFDSIVGNAASNGRGRCCAFEAKADFAYAGLLFVYNVEPDENYLLEKGVSLHLLSQFRMYLPMEQIKVFIPLTAGSKEVPEEKLSAFLADKQNIMDAVHIGSRKTLKPGYARLERFINENPKDNWRNVVNSAERTATVRARKRAGELAELKTAKREMIRILNGLESVCLYLGKDFSQVEDMREQYKAVYHALTNFHVTVDSVCLIRTSVR